MPTSSVCLPIELPLSRETKEKLMSSSERITNDNEGNGCKNWNRAPFGPGDSGMFRILKCVCPLGSLLADGRAYTSAKQWFPIGTGDKPGFRHADSETT
jgi:hypothetical protein